jgi:hypothetical protein
MRVINGLFTFILGTVLLVAAITIAVVGCSGVFDKIADTVLANEVRFDDREAPRTAYAIKASADNVQLLGGQGNGLSCSLPPGTQALAFGRRDESSYRFANAASLCIS